jgi:hypothetical protein
VWVSRLSRCNYTGSALENDIEEKSCTLLTFLEFLVLVSLLTLLDFLTVATDFIDCPDT